MKLPLPRNRLVMLTLVGALVSATAAIALATPDALLPEPSTAAAQEAEATMGPPADMAPSALDAAPAPAPFDAPAAAPSERDLELLKKQWEWQREQAKQAAEEDDE